MLGKIYIFAIYTLYVLLGTVSAAQAQISSDLLSKAENGNAMAQHRIGYIYHTGRYGQKDLSKARHWYDMAAAQGLAKSEFAIAQLLTSEAEGPKNFTAALPWIIRAAAPREASQGQGYAESQKYARETLDWMCKQGIVDFPKMMPQSKDSYCLYRRGRRLFYGSKKRNISRDYIAARKTLHKALDGGEPRAAEYLMRIYGKGYGTEKNPELYQKMMEIAAENGDGNAIMALAHQNKDTLSQDQQMTYLQRAAKDGHYKANKRLGDIYMQNGQDIEQALTHYFLAGRTRFPARHSIFSKHTPLKDLLEDPQAGTLFNAAKLKAERIAKDGKFSKRKRERIAISYEAISSRHNAVQKNDGHMRSKEENWLYMLLTWLIILALIRPLRFAISLGKRWLYILIHQLSF